MHMDGKHLDLKQVAADTTQTDRIVARLAGEMDDKAVRLWGEEFAASGGGKTPPPGGGTG